MSLYLNKNNDSLKKDLKSEIFIDKSLLIKETNKLFGTNSCYMCVTRPRRFGKSMALSMLNAYYSKGCNSKELFNGLKITNENSYLEHLNKHNVIWIDMASLYSNIDNVLDFVRILKNKILKDLKETYPKLDYTDLTLGEAIVEINSKYNERFIFLIDEWDVIYREEERNTKLCDEYTMFLRGLFKSSDVSACIDLVYMTGILPIRRYTTQSTLNMFTEYNMIDSDNLSIYFGFTEGEVKNLCIKYNRDFNEIKSWYNGYKLGGFDIYNPKSVVEAVSRGACKDYWTKTSAIEAVTNYMNYDEGILKDTIAKMISGEKVEVNASRFSNDLTKVNSSDSALTVLIHLGYLAYDEESKSCYIPNLEIRNEFVNGLEELNWMDIYNPISNSKKMYEETIKGNLEFINETLDKNHLSLARPFNKNKEDILGVIVQISYYYAKQFYNVKKEDTSILVRADISFIPYDNCHIPMFVELKVDDEPQSAINQIKERKYYNSLGDYHGDVLLLGITYNDKTLNHDSKIEIIKI
jgi:hypothetical protein